jgi:hypothetical protein
MQVIGPLWRLHALHAPLCPTCALTPHVPAAAGRNLSGRHIAPLAAHAMHALLETSAPDQAVPSDTPATAATASLHAGIVPPGTSVVCSTSVCVWDVSQALWLLGCWAVLYGPCSMELASCYPHVFADALFVSYACP